MSLKIEFYTDGTHLHTHYNALRVPNQGETLRYKYFFENDQDAKYNGRYLVSAVQTVYSGETPHFCVELIKLKD